MKPCKNLLNRLAYSLTILFLCFACKQNSIAPQNINSKTIYTTSSWLSKNKIVTMRPGTCRYADTIIIEGSVKNVPSNIYYVCLNEEAAITKILAAEGSRVSQFEPLAVIESNMFLDLKAGFLASKAAYDYRKSAFQRQGELTMEQAGTIKKMEEAQYSYLIAEAEYICMRAKLQSIGVDPEKLSAEMLNNRAYLLSPVNGNLIACKALQGNRYSTYDNLFAIATASNKIIEFNHETFSSHWCDSVSRFNISVSDTFFYAGKCIAQPLCNGQGSSLQFDLPAGLIVDNEARAVLKFVINTPCHIVPTTAVIENKYILAVENNVKVKVYEIQVKEQTSEGLTIEWLHLGEGPEIIINPPGKLLRKLLRQAS
ncbi:MAG: hypothetical protein JXB34_10620 [Bacteroidales bacterium]|nr:hypothetical protein [Bacteroidales bacterium]